MASQIPLFSLEERSASMSQAIVTAFHQHGFLYVSSSPFFSPLLLTRTFSLSRTFFSLPPTTKSKYSMQPNNRGWTSIASEVLDPSNQPQGDPKEAFNFGEFDCDGKARQPLPEDFTEAEADLAEFQRRCRELCTRLLECIGEGLEVEDEENTKEVSNGAVNGATAKFPGRHYFSTRHARIPTSNKDSASDSGTILRFLHYPPAKPSSSEAPSILAGAHSDYGSLTLLFRQPNDAGLEILTNENQWVPVPASPHEMAANEPPPVLVNVGDLLSFWTGGLLRSTVHRVVGPKARDDTDSLSKSSQTQSGDRYSIAFFCHPRRDIQLDLVPSRLVSDFVKAKEETVCGYGSGSGYNNANGRTITADEHLQRRLRATYGSLEGD